MMLPAEFVVRIELAANVIAVNTWEARVEVPIVETSPLLPRNVKPCDGPVMFRVPTESKVDDAFANDEYAVDEE
jgi:hypothetical protein